jgi:hypothetical protein
MDLVDIIIEKRFLGQEFLTWVLCKIGTQGGEVPISEDNYLLMGVSGLIQMDDGKENLKDQLTCKGHLEPKEVMSGLLNGKKAEQAKLKLVVNDLEYSLTFKASKFELCGIKFPKAALIEEDNDEERDGLILDRIGLIKAVTGAIENVFQRFLFLRTSEELWRQELIVMQKWIEEAA